MSFKEEVEKAQLEIEILKTKLARMNEDAKQKEEKLRQLLKQPITVLIPLSYHDNVISLCEERQITPDKLILECLDFIEREFC